MKRMIGSLCFIMAIIWAIQAWPDGIQHKHHGSASDARTNSAALEVRDDPDQRVMTLRIGPLDLPAHSDHLVVSQAPAVFMTIPFDGWFISYHPRLKDASGQILPGSLLHHVAFWYDARRDFLCPDKPEHIFGAGGELNDWPAIPGYGYRVKGGDRIRIDTMFHNPTDSDYRFVHLEVALEYRRKEAGLQSLMNIYPVWFDVRECDDSSYDLVPGENVTTGEFLMPHSGVLLGVGGHLHDFGRRLALVNLTQQETIATLEPKLDGEGRLFSIPVVKFIDRGGFRLNKGDFIRVTATYDNRTGSSLPKGAMGIVVGYFIRDDKVEDETQ